MAQYQVLARKYRPKNFGELIGQSHVADALANAIDTGRLHHAYLFTGTRGVGKTTIARILAKCLNCETGITSKPCGACDTCVSIDNGRFIDLIEIDAASRTKVEDTRDLLENVPYAPTQGRYKVYLIDEVHMLSTHSFNALLKTLEEPPEHVKFILATTDPQKLPVTIISRCLQFVLRPLSQELLHAHLSKILQNEQVSFSEQAVWQLAQSAKGSVRDALSLTDQAIAFGGGQLSDTTVASMLGLVDSLDVLSLLNDIYFDNRQKVASHIARLRSQMVDAAAILDKLVDSIHSLAMVQILPNVPLDMNETHKARFFELARAIDANTLQLHYEIATKARDSVRLATTPMQALEMGILRLLAFRPLSASESIAPPTFADNAVQDDNEVQNTDAAQKADLTQETNSHQDDVINAVEMSDEMNDDVDGLSDSQDSSESMAQAHLDDAEFLSQDNVHQDNIDNEVSEIKPSDLLNAETPSDTDGQISGDIDNPPSTDLSSHSSNGAISQQKADLQAELLASPVDLTGEWTAEKWDYWLSLARRDGALDNDELALFSNSQMTGSIDGESTLYVPSHNSQIETSFNSAKAKIRQYFPQIQLNDTLLLLSDDDKMSIPYALQEQRNAAVLAKAQNLIIQSPAVQMLWQQGFIVNDGSPILSGTKLTLSP